MTFTESPLKSYAARGIEMNEDNAGALPLNIGALLAGSSLGALAAAVWWISQITW
jgi:hypothetical protein